VLCEIRQKDFESLLAAYPELSLQLLKSVGLRLKKAEAHLLNVICNDVSTRVREALLNLIVSEAGTLMDQPIRINITQQDLANLIGASRQKTWQALKELEAASVLRLMYRSILVTAPHKLRKRVDTIYKTDLVRPQLLEPLRDAAHDTHRVARDQ
jgi:CRP-like cAMP-binding protein